MKAINIIDDVGIQARTCQFDLLNIGLNNGNLDGQSKYLDEMGKKLSGIES